MVSIVTTRRQFDIKGMAREIGTVVSEYLDRQTKTCLNCEHFDEPNEICRMVGKRPPARIIAMGCEYHDDIIPF